MANDLQDKKQYEGNREIGENKSEKNSSETKAKGESQKPEGQSQSKSEGVRADKGTGYFPLSDMQFDVVTLIYEKSKALQAYDKYLLDCQPCEELRSLVECMRNHDKEDVEKLKEFLGKC
ncbi:hypothetical protein KF913_17660 [Candidatus Obscuribacterales bacterium]|nr:hypothetical protein [Candidatus Obscuribacterales bacterium]